MKLKIQGFFLTLMFLIGLSFYGIYLFNSNASANEILDPELEINFQNEQINDFYNSIPKGESYRSDRPPVLIQGAMNIETNVLIRALTNPVRFNCYNYLFVAGEYKNYPVIVARTEQGITNAAVSTILGIEKFHPIAVINQGTAGGHIPSLRVNDIVIGEKSLATGAYTTEYLPKGDGIDLRKQKLLGTYAYDKNSKNFRATKEYYADKTLLGISKKTAELNKNFRVEIGTIGSADTWLSQVDHIDFLHEKYGTSCEEMETASAAQICLIANTPFIGIRVISNNATNNGEYSHESSKIAQSFVLLVLENYIDELLEN